MKKSYWFGLLWITLSAFALGIIWMNVWIWPKLLSGENSANEESIASEYSGTISCIDKSKITVINMEHKERSSGRVLALYISTQSLDATNADYQFQNMFDCVLLRDDWDELELVFVALGRIKTLDDSLDHVAGFLKWYLFMPRMDVKKSLESDSPFLYIAERIESKELEYDEYPAGTEYLPDRINGDVWLALEKVEE